MLTNISGINSVTGYQAQLTLPSDHVNQNLGQQSSGQENYDSVRISRKARELEQTYQRKGTTLEQNHNTEREQLEREYLRDKNSLEREFNQKKQALEVDLYA